MRWLLGLAVLLTMPMGAQDPFEAVVLSYDGVEHRSETALVDRSGGKASEASLNTGLRVLTKSRNRSASMCRSRNARSGGSR